MHAAIERTRLCCGAQTVHRAVGTDTATRIEAPRAVVFCTISTEMRLVRSTMQLPPSICRWASEPTSLSRAV